MTTRTYRTEFPEMGEMPEAQQLLALGFDDESWHNDSAPRFVSPTKRITVWIEHPNPEAREGGETAPRFMVEHGQFDESLPDCTYSLPQHDVAYMGDDWAKVLDACTPT